MYRNTKFYDKGYLGVLPRTKQHFDSQGHWRLLATGKQVLPHRFCLIKSPHLTLFGALIYSPPDSFGLPLMSISACPFLLWHLRRAQMARAGRGSRKQRIIWIGSSTHDEQQPSYPSASCVLNCFLAYIMGADSEVLPLSPSPL